ncbi:MAG: transposase [Candidatus Margulisiibacteriota bacterium]
MASIITRIFRENWQKACAESKSPQLKRAAVQKNIEKIMMCRTLWLGAKEFKCGNKKCNHVMFVPNTCKSRFCPSCGFKATLNWQGAFMRRVIPSEYQHLVFSAPTLIREIFLDNRRAIVKLLFHAASRSILEFCKRREDYLPGIVGVFQSFGKSLNLHPHFHLIRTAGGILLEDGKTWVESSYLPEKSIKARFKAKILKGLRGLHRTGKLKGPFGKLSYKEFNKRLNRIHESHWWIWIGQADESHNLIPYFYITRYLFRAPITSRRIVDYSKGRYVKWLPQSRHGLSKTQAFVDTPTRFIERLATHMPDDYDHLIYYSGLYAPAYRQTYYKAAKKHFAEKNEGIELSEDYEPLKWEQMMEMSTGHNPLTCPKCGSRMRFARFLFFFQRDIARFELKNHQLIEKKIDSS